MFYIQLLILDWEPRIVFAVHPMNERVTEFQKEQKTWSWAHAADLEGR